jgi:hypothetical protein
MRARVVQLTAENERLQDESRRDLEVRVELAQAVRTLSVELCEQRVELRAVRQAHDWNNALDDLTN